MDICFLGSEIDTHFSAINLTLEKLKLYGHSVTIKRWHFGNEAEEKDRIEVEADLYLSENSVPKIVPEGSYWIEFRHGISPYKMDLRKYENLSAKIVPTLYWKSIFENVEGRDTLIVPTNGWCKMDLYHERLERKEDLKKEIYNKYSFDENKPLVVYAPTGIRHETVTKEEWINKYGNDKGYRNHGSYYHHETTEETILKYANFFEVQHPCVDRSVSALDRIDVIAVSDLLISDISSMALEYTAVDKPIILLKKRIEDQDPRDFRLCGYQKEPIIDLGDIISIEELDSVLKYRLINDDYKETRKYWKELLLGNIDGKCAEREALAILDIAKSIGEIK
jgi:hypothetical protein